MACDASHRSSHSSSDNFILQQQRVDLPLVRKEQRFLLVLLGSQRLRLINRYFLNGISVSSVRVFCKRLH
jgi:hypothetical protein